MESSPHTNQWGLSAQEGLSLAISGGLLNLVGAEAGADTAAEIEEQEARLVPACYKETTNAGTP